MDILQRDHPEILREILSYVTPLSCVAQVNKAWYNEVKKLPEDIFYFYGGEHLIDYPSPPALIRARQLNIAYLHGDIGDYEYTEEEFKIIIDAEDLEL